jgi:hypothetical protein
MSYTIDYTTNSTLKNIIQKKKPILKSSKETGELHILNNQVPLFSVALSSMIFVFEEFILSGVLVATITKF